MAFPCKDCLTGSLHTETPTGRVTTLHGLPTYVSEPEGDVQPKGIIVQHADAFGWDLPNARVIADRYAKRTGCRVYTPDFLGGYSLQHDLLESMEFVVDKQPTWGATLYKIFPVLRLLYHVPSFAFNCRNAVVQPRTTSFFRDLRNAEARNLPVGIAGFCLGGFFTFDLAKDTERVNGRPLIDCGFTAHPSNLRLPKDGEEAKRPISVSTGDQDFVLPADKANELKKTLEDKSSVDHEMVILPGVKHGFAVRWNPHNQKENEWAQLAEDQAVNWFKKQFRI